MIVTMQDGDTEQKIASGIREGLSKFGGGSFGE